MPEYNKDIAVILISTTLSAIMVLGVCRRLNKIQKDFDEVVNTSNEVLDAMQQKVVDSMFYDIVEHYDD